jgi:hypothetical protein
MEWVLVGITRRVCSFTRRSGNCESDGGEYSAPSFCGLSASVKRSGAGHNGPPHTADNPFYFLSTFTLNSVIAGLPLPDLAVILTACSDTGVSSPAVTVT